MVKPEHRAAVALIAFFLGMYVAIAVFKGWLP